MYLYFLFARDSNCAFRNLYTAYHAPFCEYTVRLLSFSVIMPPTLKLPAKVHFHTDSQGGLERGIRQTSPLDFRSILFRSC